MEIREILFYDRGFGLVFSAYYNVFFFFYFPIKGKGSIAIRSNFMRFSTDLNVSESLCHVYLENQGTYFDPYFCFVGFRPMNVQETDYHCALIEKHVFPKTEERKRL